MELKNHIDTKLMWVSGTNYVTYRYENAWREPVAPRNAYKIMAPFNVLVQYINGVSMASISVIKTKVFFIPKYFIYIGADIIERVPVAQKATYIIFIF